MVHFRNIFVPIVAVILLLLAGCHQETATMKELSHIDTLLTTERQYEDALQLLDSLDSHAFNKAEQAYYSLLITQAHYKNYIDDTTDAVIKVAVDYYKNSHDKEKYTRSLIYQGCVNELNGNPEKAVECYHKAEASADQKDIANRAFAHLRLGFLYQSQMIGNKTIAAKKFKEAMDEFALIQDKHYEMVSVSELGSIYREFKEKEQQDSALSYNSKAIALAKELNDQYYEFANLFVRAEFYELFIKDYSQAKNDAVKAISVGDSLIDHPRAHLCAASAYLHLGQKDSAMYYLARAPKLVSVADSVKYYNLLADIALSDNNTERWLYYHNQAHSMADSVLIGSLNYRLLEVEKKYDHQMAVLNRVESEARLKEALLLAALLALSLLATCFMVWRYRNQLKMRQNEVEMLKADLNGSLTSLEQMQKRLDSREQNEEGKKRQSEELRAIINKQIDAVHQLMEWSYQYEGDKFAAKFKETMTLTDVGDDSNYWTNLQTLVNDLHDNVLIRAQEVAGGTLTENELNLLALYCCGFSFTVIMVTMGYKHIGTVYNKKNQITKKLGVNNLDEFVAPFQEKKE